MMISWNGVLIEGREVPLPVSSAGFLRGEGVFETMRFEGGEICLWDDHFMRLVGSAKILGLEVPGKRDLEENIERVVSGNNLSRARVRVTLGVDCLIMAESLPETSDEVKVVMSDCPVNELSPLAQVKCTSYAENMVLLRASGVDEAIRPNTRGELCEGCYSNVFFVRGGVIHTPSLESGCLPGVMRGELIRRLEIVVGVFPVADLLEADEIWLTNAVRRIRPVSEFNGRSLPARDSELFREANARLGWD